jgi:hypothetical protein
MVKEWKGVSKKKFRITVREEEEEEEECWKTY